MTALKQYNVLSEQFYDSGDHNTEMVMKAADAMRDELLAELAALRAFLARIDTLVSEVPKTGDPDSAVMDVMRVVCEWAAREEASDAS
jgi:hypothetical protein